MAGFERPSTGRVLLRDQAIQAPGAERGVVFQQGALFNWMTVVENVAFGPRARGMAAGLARERARALLAMVGLDAFAGKYPYQLSGGMQQRVGIARALAKTILWITHSIDEALFLATHIAVMSARPGTLKAAFRARFNEVEDPLVATTAEFTAAKRQIVALLREESRQAQAQEAAR